MWRCWRKGLKAGLIQIPGAVPVLAGRLYANVNNVTGVPQYLWRDRCGPHPQSVHAAL